MESEGGSKEVDMVKLGMKMELPSLSGTNDSEDDLVYISLLFTD